jgi:tripartite-type tricarboxylate transporter receptor subunit TctC
MPNMNNLIGLQETIVKRLPIGFGVLLAILFAAGVAASADYPTRPVRIVVPFPPGGTIDLQARSLAAQLVETFKQPVIVDNRPGAGTTIGTGYAAKATPDGHTLLLALRTIAVSPAVYAKLSFDPIRDFDPISLVESTYWVFCTHPSLPAKSFKEFIALAKSRPGALNVGNTGVGTDNHLTMEQFQRAAGIQVGQIPYSGGGPAVIALLGGQVEALLVPGPLSIPHIKSGKMRPIAIFNDRRAPSLPDVPTITEEGYAGFGGGAWSGLFAPKGTPEKIIRLLNAEVQKYVRHNRETGTLFIEGIQVPESSTPQAMATLVRNEVAKWQRIAKEVGLKPE